MRAPKMSLAGAMLGTHSVAAYIDKNDFGRSRMSKNTRQRRFGGPTYSQKAPNSRIAFEKTIFFEKSENPRQVERAAKKWCPGAGPIPASVGSLELFSKLGPPNFRPGCPHQPNQTHSAHLAGRGDDAMLGTHSVAADIDKNDFGRSRMSKNTRQRRFHGPTYLQKASNSPIALDISNFLEKCENPRQVERGPKK